MREKNEQRIKAKNNKKHKKMKKKGSENENGRQTTNNINTGQEEADKTKRACDT